MDLDIIELENGLKMPVIDAINYQGRIFVLLGTLNEEEMDIENQLLVYEKYNNEIISIDDQELVQKLVQTFKNRMNNKQ